MGWGRVLFERACRHASAARPGGEVLVFCDGRVVVWDVLAVAGDAVVGSVEDRGVERVVCVFLPCPVGLVAVVAAFVAKGLLVGPGEVAVPGEEVALLPVVLSGGSLAYLSTDI